MPGITKKTADKIKTFTQHGFIPTLERGEEIEGVCPFCKGDKFYVNMERHTYHCKHGESKYCDKGGGFQTFLQVVNQFCRANFRGAVVKELSKNRGLSVETLQNGGVGYNPITGRYTIPIWGADRDKLLNIRIFDGKALYSTAGCTTELFLPAYDATKTDIHLCEGEWDALAIMEALKLSNDEDSIVVASPGAGTFKSQWDYIFTQKIVYCLYDNDTAGQKGAVKVYNMLNEKAKKLYFINWPEGIKDKYDIRDLYIDKKGKDRPDKFFDVLGKMLEEIPQIVKNVQDKEGGTEINFSSRQSILERRRKRLTGDFVPAEEVYKVYRKWYYLPDTDIIDVAFGSIIANRFSNDPLWLFLVAPPGMFKSTLIQSLTDVLDIKNVSSLTPASLVSGSTVGGDPSLIPQLRASVMAMKDFTPTLQMNITARDEIFSILRDAYDGEITRVFGNGVVRAYKECQFGIIAGVTPVIENYLGNETSLGERFLRFHVPLPSSLDEQVQYLQSAARGINTTQARKETTAIASRSLSHDFQDNVQVPETAERRIIFTALLTSILRSTIIRDKFRNDEITFQPFQEIGTRLTKQYIKLAKGIAMFRGETEIGEHELSIISKVAKGTIPSRLKDTLEEIMRRKKSSPDPENFSFIPQDIAGFIRLSPRIVGHMVDNLYILGMLKKEKIDSFRDRYFLKSNMENMIFESKIFENASQKRKSKRRK